MRLLTSMHGGTSPASAARFLRAAIVAVDDPGSLRKFRGEHSHRCAQTALDRGGLERSNGLPASAGPLSLVLPCMPPARAPVKFSAGQP